MQCCVDASCVLRLWLPGPGQRAAHDRWLQWREQGTALVAPTLLAYEVTNALHQQVRQGRLPPAPAALLLATLDELGIAWHVDGALHQRALVLAAQCAMGATYDAHYLAVCEQLDATLWTADRRLGKAATQLGLAVEMLA